MSRHRGTEREREIPPDEGIENQPRTRTWTPQRKKTTRTRRRSLTRRRKAATHNQTLYPIHIYLGDQETTRLRAQNLPRSVRTFCAHSAPQPSLSCPSPTRFRTSTFSPTPGISSTKTWRGSRHERKTLNRPGIQGYSRICYGWTGGYVLLLQLLPLVR